MSYILFMFGISLWELYTLSLLLCHLTKINIPLFLLFILLNADLSVKVISKPPDVCFVPR